MTVQNSLEKVVLNWVQPKWAKNEYQLRNGKKPIGSLTFLSFWNRQAIAIYENNYFTFERQGFWKLGVSIHSKDNVTLGTFNGGIYGRGTLELANGRRFQWKRTSFLGSKWAWVDEQGLLLAQLKSKAGWRKFGEVEITELGQQLPELSLLTLLGGYVLVYIRASAITTVGSSA